MLALRRWSARLGSEPIRSELLATGAALLLVAALTAAISALQQFVVLETVTTIYLIPVLVGAIRGGVVPAVIAALAAICTSAFFFYAPIYDFHVQSPLHLVDLILFIVVAVVTGQLAANVRQAKLRAEAERLRDALIGSVSHELRTPLSSIMGAASILAASPEIACDGRLSGLVRVLREETDRLDSDIENLLDATRISSESIRPHAEWVDPADIVNAAINHKHKLLADRSLSVLVADNLPLVQIDSTLIERALRQLLENAVKYSPAESPIQIAASYAAAAAAVLITVEDRGVGLSSEELERMWERFYRSPRHRETIAGSGLGLWIARSLVVACGGRIAAFSAGAGRGTSLTIELPVASRIPETLGESPNE